MKILKIILLIGIILLGVSFIQKDELSFPKNEVVEKLFQEPIQTETDKDEFKVSREGMTYTITPLFNYELYGLVVSYNNSDHWLDYHHNRWQDFVNIKDVCVIWGDNINSEVYKAMKFKSGSIACHATFKFRTKKEISSKFKPNCLSNNHLLSDNEKINKILKKVKTGDQIYLKGYLAEYSNDEGWYGIEGYDAKRGTSVTRTDTGNSCETIYLTDFQILKRTNAFWHYTYDFSKYLIIFCLIFGVIIFFFFDDFLRKKRFEKQKEILTINKKGGFMKKPIIVILILLAIIGSAGIIYATGNFDKVVDKVFRQDEVEEKEEKKTLTIEEKRDNQRIADLQIISDALDEYASQNKKTENPYPISNGLEKISDEPCILHKVFKEAMSEIPVDPKHPKSWYGYKSDGKTYELTAVLEDKNNTRCIINKENICIYRVRKTEISIKNPEVDNWKTYRNKEYGFEIKYPKDWYTYENIGVKHKIISTFSQDKYKKYFGMTDHKKLGKNSGLILLNDLIGKSVEDKFEFIKSKIENIKNGKRDTFKIEKFIAEEINVEGVKGYKIYYHYYENSIMYEEGVHIVYIFPDKNSEKGFHFEGDFAGEDEKVYKEYAEDFDQMISTFRFLE